MSGPPDVAATPKRYVVMHDWNAEGWKIVGETDSTLEAVRMREDDLRTAGGVVEIFERRTVLERYQAALVEAGIH